MNKKQMLAQIPVFKNLESAELDHLNQLLRKLVVRKGDVLFRKSSEGNALYFIKDGAIKIVLPSRLGEDRIVTIFSTGDFFGEMALLDGLPRSADAIAVRPSTLFVLDRREFLMFLKRNETAMETILATLSTRLRNTDELLEDSSFLNIPARLAKKLLEIGRTFGRQDGRTMKINLKLTQQELADMIGSTRESVNKELQVLKKRGLISIDEMNIHIHDSKRLRRRIH